MPFTLQKRVLSDPTVIVVRLLHPATAVGAKSSTLFVTLNVVSDVQYANASSLYGAQNEAYMSRSAEKWVRGLCFN